MRIQEENNRQEIGKRHLVLAEGVSKRSDAQLSGRTDTNKMVVFDRENFQKGEYIEVEITDCTSATLIGRPIRKSSIQEYAIDRKSTRLNSSHVASSYAVFCL